MHFAYQVLLCKTCRKENRCRYPFARHLLVRTNKYFEENMTFSVLQSVYKKDNPEFLSQSLQSIADNTVQPSEIVLVKDGALTAELEAVIAEWQEKLPLKVVGYEENRGLAHALNYGLQFVETELVARMDSDDLCFPDRFEKQVLQFEIDNKLSVLGAGIEEFYSGFDKLNHRTDEVNYRINFRQIRLYPKRTTRVSASLYKGTPLAHPTVMFRTSVLKQFGYSEKTKCNEDIELWFRLLAAGYEIRTLQVPLLYFRITDGTFRRRSIAKAFDEFAIYSRNLRSFKGLSKNHLYLLLRLCARLIPNAINRRLYLSAARKNMFKENLMKVKSINGQVFMKNGHLFEALLEVEEDGKRLIKAVQLDADKDSNNTIEISADEVQLYCLKDSANVLLNL